MYDANVKATGGYISGEVKVAIALRLLAGGDALDLSVMFDVSCDHCNMILYQVLLHWIIKPNIGKLNMKKYLGDKPQWKTGAKDLQKDQMVFWLEQ